MADKSAFPPLRYRQPSTRLRIWGITAPDIDEKTGYTRDTQPGDFGVAFEIHVGAPTDRQYALDGFDVERDMFMTMLEIAKVRQFKRIARALEKMAGIEHDEPEDHLDSKPPRET